MENIKINTHSSIKIEEGKKVFYFDPYEIKWKINDADYIFITHDHYDHLDPKSIQKVIKDNTKIICPKGFAKIISQDSGIRDISRIIEVEPNQEVKLDENIYFETIPAYNIDKNFHKREYNYLGFVLCVNNIRYYIAGDTDMTEEAMKVKCDIALVPIGGTYTMTYDEAAKLINHIKPKVAIPTHYGSVVGEYNLGKKFIELVDKNIETKELVDKEPNLL